MKPLRSPARQVLPRSNKGFFVVMALCALGAIILASLLVTGEIQGERVAPDIPHRARDVK